MPRFCRRHHRLKAGMGSQTIEVRTTLAALTPCADGAYPGLLLNVNGTLYGVTAYRGSGTCNTTYYGPGCGTVFAITP